MENETINTLFGTITIQKEEKEQKQNFTPFDFIKDILTERSPKNKVLTQIGAPVQEKEKIKLPFHMGSLDKIKPDRKNTSDGKKGKRTSTTTYQKAFGGYIPKTIFG